MTCTFSCKPVKLYTGLLYIAVMPRPNIFWFRYFPSPGSWQIVEKKCLLWNSNLTMTQSVTMFSLVFAISLVKIHSSKHSCPCVFNWQLCETSELLMCVSLVFVCECLCVCRSLAVSVNTTHAGRAVIVVALVTISRPGWQEPSTPDMSVRVRKMQHNNKLHILITHNCPQVYSSLSATQQFLLTQKPTLLKLFLLGNVLLEF